MKLIHMITETKCYNIKVECDFFGDVVIVCKHESRAANKDHSYIVEVDLMELLRMLSYFYNMILLIIKWYGSCYYALITY